MANSPTTPPPPPQVRWDDSSVHNVHLPNFCNVSSNAREVTLLFGTSQPGSKEVAEVVVKLGNRVVLRPIAAKLLGTLLQETLVKHEIQHGPIGNGYQPLPGSPTLVRTAGELELLDRERLPPKASLLLELIEGLRIRFTVERSVKVLAGAFLSNRFLITIARTALTPQAHSRLPVICKRLGIPDEFLEIFQREYSGAEFIHFGFEESPSGATFKTYLEFANKLTTALAVPAGNPEPFELYVGYKWDVADKAKRAISHYQCYPNLPVPGIHTRIAALFPNPSSQATLEIALNILGVAARSTHPNELLYVEVEEPGNPRRSFDLNLYPARLQLAEFYPILLSICSLYAIPAEAFEALYVPFKSAIFGHVSGGVDREGRDFLTIYFGPDRPRH